MTKADRRARKKQHAAEARARRIHLEIWPEPQEDPIMVDCDGCHVVQVNTHVHPGDVRFVFPCICSAETAAHA